MFKNSNILVTGGTGMIGRHLIDLLKEESPSSITSVSLDSSKIQDVKCLQLDLTNFDNCLNITQDKDYVFHLAGIKGSPKMAKEQPANFTVPMLMFNTNLLEAARRNCVTWLLYTSSIGVYQPAEILKEDDVWNTMPSKNDWYAGWTKRMGELQIEAYQKQYNKNNMSIVRPGNVYGKYDNFNPETSMVIPALIARICGGENPLKVWGDGSAERDFVDAQDVARGMIWAVKHKICEPINLSSGTLITIKDLVEYICSSYQQLTGTSVSIEWDVSKPTGDARRLMSMDRARGTGFTNTVSIEEGILSVMKWYLTNGSFNRERFDVFASK